MQQAVKSHSVAKGRVDVAVMGGGPAGLAVANAVLRARPGTSVKVFEAVQKYTPQGAGVLLNINGFRALKAIDPALHDRLEHDSMYLSSMVWVNEQGEETKKAQIWDHEATKKRTGYAHKMISWHDIRNTLYEQLPPGIVEFGCKGRGFRHLEDGSVELRYDTTSRPAEADGSGAGTGESEEAADAAADKEEAAAGRSTRHTIQATILVAADGYFSRIREAILHDGPPEFTGRLTWRARVEKAELMAKGVTADAWLTDPAACRLWCNVATLGKDRSAIVYPIGGGNYVWTANCPVSRLEEKGLSFQAHKQGTSNMTSIQMTGDTGSDAAARCLKMFEDYPQELVQIFAATPNQLVTEHGYFIRKPENMPEKSWGEGGVTLVGDAAHLAPPDGQGLNLALEDAAVLGWHLQQSGLTPQALRAFEAERIPRVKAILSYSEMQPERQKLVEEKEFHPLGQ